MGHPVSPICLTPLFDGTIPADKVGRAAARSVKKHGEEKRPRSRVRHGPNRCLFSAVNIFFQIQIKPSTE